MLWVHVQHLKDYLDLDQSALKYMMKCYPEEKEEEQMRRSLGKYGLTGKQQVCIDYDIVFKNYYQQYC